MAIYINFECIKMYLLYIKYIMGGGNVPIKYKINVLAELKAIGYSTYRLRKEKIFGERTMQKFRRGEIVNAENMAIVCKLLNCQPGDIMEYVDEQNDTIDNTD